jgi:hypothetical protein
VITNEDGADNLVPPVDGAITSDSATASATGAGDTFDLGATEAASESGLDAVLAGPLESISLPAVDWTAFQSLPFDDAFSNGMLFVSIVAFIVAMLYVTGLAMKVACHVTGGGKITIRRGIVATILVSVAYGLAAFVTEFLSSGASSLMMIGIPILVGALALALLLWQNPIRALATGIIASILQTIFLFGFFAGAFILIGKFVPTQKLNQLAQHTQSLTDSLAEDVLPGDEEKIRQLLSVKSLVDPPSGQDDDSAKPQVTPLHERTIRSNPFVQ